MIFYRYKGNTLCLFISVKDTNSVNVISLFGIYVFYLFWYILRENIKRITFTFLLLLKVTSLISCTKGWLWNRSSSKDPFNLFRILLIWEALRRSDYLTSSISSNFNRTSTRIVQGKSWLNLGIVTGCHTCIQ